MTRIQELEDAGDEKDIETRELMRALGTLQSRSDIALNEQSRLEADLEARDEVLERVRARLTMAEREVRDVQARYNEQVSGCFVSHDHPSSWKAGFGLTRRNDPLKQSALLSKLKKHISNLEYEP